jgi:hypothetical protein
MAAGKVFERGPHYLVVQPFDPDDDTDRFDIEHPSCATEEIYGGAAVHYTCAVEAHVEAAGIDGYFRHADDPHGDLRRTPVGVGWHRIEAWQEAVRTLAGMEYNAGLQLADGAS